MAFGFLKICMFSRILQTNILIFYDVLLNLTAIFRIICLKELLVYATI